jgi:Flp pilus assembly protein TadD
MHDAGEHVSFNALHEMLTPPDQERLSAIVLEGESGAVTVEDGEACVEKLIREDREVLRRELKAQIKAAEREGRMKDAIELMHRLADLG